MKINYLVKWLSISLTTSLTISLGSVKQSQAVVIAAPGTEGLPVIATGGDVTATYLGSGAGYINFLYFEPNSAPPVSVFNNQTSVFNSTLDLGSFAAGTQLNFRLNVTNTGNNFYTGAAALTPDNQPQARVQANYLVPGTTLVSFEDLYGGPYDYNDLSFSLTNTTNQATSVPEPVTIFGTLIGGTIAFRLRKKLKAIAD